MTIRLFIGLIFTFAAAQASAQTLIGGAGTCKTNGDPDLIADLQAVDQRYTCSTVWDTVNNTLYVYDASASLGQRWSPLSGDNLGDHSATELLDMNRFQIQEVDAVAGGVDVGNNDNVAKIGFNSDIGSTVPANAMTLESNSGLMITSDRNDNAVVKSTEPIIFSQGSINSDSPGYFELLRMNEGTFRIAGTYNMAMTAPPEDGDGYVQTWTNGANSWASTSSFGGGGSGIWQVQNSNSLASDNTTYNYHRGNIGIGDFSSSTIGASFHLYSPNMTMRLSDSCSTDQCATPLLEFYRGRNTSLLGRAGYLSSADNDFSFINNIAAGKLKFGTDATVKLELLASGQARLNQYTSNSSFSGTPAGYLAFDSNGYIITDAGTSGGGSSTTFTGLTDTPSDYTGDAGKYVQVNSSGSGLEFVTAPPGGGYAAIQVPNNNLTLNYDLNAQETGIWKLNLEPRNRWEIAVANPPPSIAGEYSFQFTNAGSPDTITFPGNFLFFDSTAVGSVALNSDKIQKVWFDGSNYWTDANLGAALSGVPTCSDGIQNGDEAGIDCGGSCPNTCGGAPSCTDGIQNGDETGVDCGGSCPPCSGGFDVDYQNVLDWGSANFATLPSASVQTAQNQLVVDLKAAGVWDSLDILYVFAGDGDIIFSNINWVSPGVNNAQFQGGMSFHTNEGAKSDGINGYVNTGYNLAAEAVNYKVDYGQIMFHVYSGGNVWNTASAICGAREDANVTTPQLMLQNSANNDILVRMQSYGNTIGAYEYLLAGPPPAYTGTFLFDRENGNTLTAFHNNVQFATDNTSENHPSFPSREVYLFANNTGGVAANFNYNTLSMWAIGGFGSNRSAAHSAWNTYSATLGGL